MKAFSVDTVAMDANGWVVLKLVGSLSSSTSPSLQAHIDKLIEKDYFRIVLDLSKMEFISSSGIGLFVGTVSTLRTKGGDLVLMKVPKQIENILDVNNIRNYFPMIYDLKELETVKRGA